ncbi:MAG: outer membrane protein assembly factor BamE [Comamonas sp.]|nr:outer membrane protein assembly factor BamE [Comamonas sp.]
MSAIAHRRRLLNPLGGTASALFLPLLLSACSSISDAPRNTLHALTPYKVEVVQGNFVSREQVQALQRGMSRQQVREILGTPLITSVFHDERWEYVFTIQRQGVAAQNRKLTVYFSGERFSRVEGDEMPSEEEFVASLGRSKGKLKIPPLEATEAQLAKYANANTNTSSASSISTPSPAVSLSPNSHRSYPPLEPQKEPQN